MLMGTGGRKITGRRGWIKTDRERGRGEERRKGRERGTVRLAGSESEK